MAEPYRRVVYLPIALTNGNTGRTTHFGASAKRRREYEHVVRMKYGQLLPPNFKQRVTVIRVLGKGEKFWDPDSVLRGSAKELLDALVACGFANDDSSAWLEAVDGRQDASERTEGPAVKIILEKA